MFSTKPYLIRAFYAWIVDNKCTPYIVVNASHRGSRVPLEYVENDQIVLNIAKSAVQELDLSNEIISFQASFNKIPQFICFPVSAVMAIYAKENGRGMVFAEEEYAPTATGKPAPNVQISLVKPIEGNESPIKTSPPKRAHLSLVKSPEPEAEK